MDNSNYFFISGALSLSLFVLIIALFFVFLLDAKKINSYALNKNNYISISLDTPIVTKKTSQKQAKSSPQESKSQEEIQEVVDVNDLFSDVWTKKIVHKEEKVVNSKRLQEIKNKINKLEFKSSKAIESSTSKGDSQKEEQSASSAAEVNEYLAKIQAIVYNHFNVPQNSQGSSVKTIIELNALGKMIDFRVLVYSQNSELNAEADRIKERLRNVVFPVNPQNKASKTVVILIAKE